MTEFAEWDSFYLIVGGAAGALIGLQFVVMTLIADRSSAHGPEAGSAFATPNIVHFVSALVLSALIRVPWKTVTPISVIWGVIGITGVIYVVIVVRRMRAQNSYKPVFEDWLFHAVLPLIAYALLATASFTASSSLNAALFVVGGGTLLLLLIGIHNAWDTTTYNVFTMNKNASDESSDAIDMAVEQDVKSPGNS